MSGGACEWRCVCVEWQVRGNVEMRGNAVGERRVESATLETRTRPRDATRAGASGSTPCTAGATMAGTRKRKKSTPDTAVRAAWATLASTMASLMPPLPLPLALAVAVALGLAFGLKRARTCCQMSEQSARSGGGMCACDARSVV